MKNNIIILIGIFLFFFSITNSSAFNFETKKLGKVKWYNIDLRYGFITILDTKTDIFVHKNNIDVHTRTAANIFGINSEDVNFTQRRTAKVVNFSIMYGAGPFRLSQELDIKLKDAKKIIEAYFETYPGIKLFMEETLSSAREKGYVETLLGRKRYADGLTSSNMNIVKAEERACINMPIQGTAAELIKIAMIKVYNKMKEFNL